MASAAPAVWLPHGSAAVNSSSPAVKSDSAAVKASRASDARATACAASASRKPRQPRARHSPARRMQVDALSAAVAAFTSSAAGAPGDKPSKSTLTAARTLPQSCRWVHSATNQPASSRAADRASQKPRAAASDRHLGCGRARQWTERWWPRPVLATQDPHWSHSW
eukprot:scaffold4837_cov121-Isochrysis_galbana.AAC.5